MHALKEKGIVLQTGTPDATWRLGNRIGLRVMGGEVIGLIGPLGAGKTVFVQGLAAGMGIQSPITSPTFVMMNFYRGRLPLCHIDLYRIDMPIEMIGHEEHLESNGVTAIEWADKKERHDFNLVIEFAYSGENERILTLSADQAHVGLLQGCMD